MSQSNDFDPALHVEPPETDPANAKPAGREEPVVTDKPAGRNDPPVDTDKPAGRLDHP